MANIGSVNLLPCRDMPDAAISSDIDDWIHDRHSGIKRKVVSPQTLHIIRDHYSKQESALIDCAKDASLTTLTIP